MPCGCRVRPGSRRSPATGGPPSAILWPGRATTKPPANALLEALQQRKTVLEPETLASVEANLRVIDQALAEVRQALVKDPRSPDLNRMLVSTHRKKVDLLRRVFRLSTAL
jgi:hypothetical protein